MVKAIRMKNAPLDRSVLVGEDDVGVARGQEPDTAATMPWRSGQAGSAAGRGGGWSAPRVVGLRAPLPHRGRGVGRGVVGSGNSNWLIGKARQRARTPRAPAPTTPFSFARSAAGTAADLLRRRAVRVPHERRQRAICSL
jgi:hypothetical protein